MHLSKPVEYALGANPQVNCALGGIMMCQCRFTIAVGDADNEEGKHVREQAVDGTPCAFSILLWF